MRKISFTFIFTLTTGIFAGIFFTLWLSSENSEYLSSLLISNLGYSGSFVSSFFSAFFSNLFLMLLMIPAIFNRYLIPLPFVIVLYKGFSLGFCNYLLYIGSEKPLLLSAIGILPQNLFYIPAIILLASYVAYMSVNRKLNNKKRALSDKNVTFFTIIISFSMLLTGSLTETLIHLSGLLPS